jgi:hypothetical protein
MRVDANVRGDIATGVDIFAFVLMLTEVCRGSRRQRLCTFAHGHRDDEAFER